MKIGKASYSGSKKENFKIKDGDNVYRVLPPMGNLADSGQWSVYGRVVWGYKGTDGKNKPFLSPRQQNYNTKMIEVDCAAFNKAMKIKDEYQEMVKNSKELVKSGGILTDAIKKELELKKEETMRFNVESKFFLNVMNLEGTIGLLKLAGSGHKLIKSLGKELDGKGVDITGVENGRYININRQGTGLDTAYQVSEFKQNKQVEIDGVMETVQRSMPHTLDESIIGRLAKEAYKLDELYPTPSEAEVKELVDAHENLSEEEAKKVVDRILAKPTQEEPTPEPKQEAAPQEKAEAKVEARTEAVKEPVETAVSEAKAEEIQTASGETVNTSTGEIKEEVKAEEPKAEAKQEDTAAANVASGAGQSDDDFLAGLKA